MKSEVPLLVKFVGSHGLDFALSNLDNLTERSVDHLPIRFSRVKAAPGSPNLLALSFRTPPIMVRLSSLRLETFQIPKDETCSSSRTAMVVPPLELCFELGYQDGIEYLPSRGPPKLLLDDLRVFIENRPFSESGESLSAAYLTTKPAGLKHKPPAGTRNTAGLLVWPRDQMM